MNSSQLKRERIRELQERCKKRWGELRPDHFYDAESDPRTPPRLKKALAEIKAFKLKVNAEVDKACARLDKKNREVRQAILFKPIEQALAAVEAFENWTP